MEQLALSILISGHVQGVWFRQSTKEQADANGVKGWVRNLPDGRVEALLYGPANGVRHVEAWMYQGPPLAEVLEVKVEEKNIEHVEQQSGFKVR